ncbi:MAG TPA: AAA family ATPase [Planctomycetota bacterium]|nr:AAA family ATPase [Planctomycetota bacterium]
MTHCRLMALVWRDFNDCYTASVPEMNASASGNSRREALNQIEDFVTWTARKEGISPPELTEARLEYFSVLLRPEYRTETRVFACDEHISLRVACVSAKCSENMLLGWLPLLGIRFYCHAHDKLKSLVEHYVRERLSGSTPGQIARYLQPPEIELTELVIRIPRNDSNVAQSLKQTVLHSVADPLDDRTLRRHIGRPYEREREVADLAQRLWSERSHILLVGEAGVGKTAVLGEAVRRACKLDDALRKQNHSGEEKEPQPRCRRFWLTQAGRIIAGMRYLGMWEERCEELIQELGECNGILCFESLLDLVRLGGREPVESIAAFFMPYMQRNEARLVAECTPAELDACRRLLPGFIELFHIVKIEPFERFASQRVLQGVSAAMQQNISVQIERQALDQIYRLFSRFRPYDAFPGQAVAFLKDVMQQARRRKAEAVSADDVISAFVRKTGLPERFLRDDVPLQRHEVEGWFQKQVIGQASACEHAASLVLTFKAGLNDAKRPLGVLLFCGQTGVGKTELARALARYLFGHGDEAHERLVRLDMSEYGGGDGATRLLSGSDGAPSDFIQRMRRQPFSVVLFDEIEKASPDVFDVLMGLFDEGRLSDTYGRVTNFRSAIIILTSNLGADKHEAAGFQMQRTPSYQDEAFKFFRPEFFNRIDAVVSFGALPPEIIRQITEKELQAIAAREGFRAAGLKLEWTPQIVARLAEAGFDRRYGARPLQRTLERMVIAPLSRHVVQNPALKNVTLKLDLDAAGLISVSEK